ncbi:hypothetical protein An16g05700 [Aspergillus niger]|uniref:Uncharacterized protein n=2 Tax=Aspergillus niger TaxID=5061 RepID=A2R836_ASPNC|nr:hypothetical protein An16g05700 [Aspergillus niger]CAK46910.1 hypothetical protein An16g05700 [Aspergillus niger]
MGRKVAFTGFDLRCMGCPNHTRSMIVDFSEKTMMHLSKIKGRSGREERNWSCGKYCVYIARHIRRPRLGPSKISIQQVHSSLGASQVHALEIHIRSRCFAPCLAGTRDYDQVPAIWPLGKTGNNDWEFGRPTWAMSSAIVMSRLMRVNKHYQSLGYQSEWDTPGNEEVFQISRNNGGVIVRFNDLRQSKFSLMAGEHLSKTVGWGGIRVEASNIIPSYTIRAKAAVRPLNARGSKLGRPNGSPLQTIMKQRSKP